MGFSSQEYWRLGLIRRIFEEIVSPLQLASSYMLWILRAKRHGLLLVWLLTGKSQGRRSLVGCSPWGHQELDTTERLHFHFSLSCIRKGNGNPLQCSCLENPRDGGAWWAAVYGVDRVGHDWSDLAATAAAAASVLLVSSKPLTGAVLSGINKKCGTLFKNYFDLNYIISSIPFNCIGCNRRLGKKKSALVTIFTSIFGFLKIAFLFLP